MICFQQHLEIILFGIKQCFSKESKWMRTLFSLCTATQTAVCFIQRFGFWASFLTRANNYQVKFHQYAWKLPCSIKSCTSLLTNIIAGTVKAASFEDERGYQSKFCCNTEAKHSLVRMEKNVWFWKLHRLARGSWDVLRSLSAWWNCLAGRLWDSYLGTVRPLLRPQSGGCFTSGCECCWLWPRRQPWGRRGPWVETGCLTKRK